MAVPYTGAQTAVGFAKETTWNTSVSRTNWLQAVSFGVQRKRPRGISPELATGTTGKGVRVDYATEDNTVGETVVLAKYVGLGFFLEALFGTVATAGGPTYTHTYTMADTLPSYTVEGALGTSSTSDVFTGMKAATGKLSVRAGELAQLSIGWMGGTGTLAGAIGTPSYGTGERIHGKHSGTLSFNAVNYTLAGLEMVLDNKLARVTEMGTLFTAEPTIAGAREFRLRATLIWRTTTLAAAQLAETEGDAVLTLTGDTSPNALAITLHNARLHDYDRPITRAGYIEKTVEFLGKADATDGGLAVVVTNGSTPHSTN